jgi:hypothetical protein
MKTATLSARRAARNEWTERAARAGFVAKGLLYAIVGVLAIEVAAGGGGKPEDQKGALHVVAGQPFGKALLVVLALGLAGYALFGLVEIVVGPRDKQGSADLVERVAAVVRVLVYGSLSVVAFRIVVGAGGGQSGSEQEQAATVLDWPGGVALMTAVGIILVGVGMYELYNALGRKFLEDLDLAELGTGAERAATVLGLVGNAARAVIFALIGVFLAKAALEYNPEEAIGLDGALQKLAGQPYGSILLGLVAAGLLLFGLYSLVEARYRKI